MELKKFKVWGGAGGGWSWEKLFVEASFDELFTRILDGLVWVVCSCADISTVFWWYVCVSSCTWSCFSTRNSKKIESAFVLLGVSFYLTIVEIIEQSS